jgi:hypothetical protein
MTIPDPGSPARYITGGFSTDTPDDQRSFVPAVRIEMARAGARAIDESLPPT